MTEINAHLKKEFDSFRKKINEIKKFIFIHLNNSKNLYVAMKNNISLLNYSQNYSDYFDQMELVKFNEILANKPDLLKCFIKKLFNNFDQIFINLRKNIVDTEQEIKSIENSLMIFLNKNKQITLEKLFLNEDFKKIKDEDTISVECSNEDYIFIYLVEIDNLLCKVKSMYKEI